MHLLLVLFYIFIKVYLIYVKVQHPLQRRCFVSGDNIASRIMIKVLVWEWDNLFHLCMQLQYCKHIVCLHLYMLVWLIELWLFQSSAFSVFTVQCIYYYKTNVVLYYVCLAKCYVVVSYVGYIYILQ